MEQINVKVLAQLAAREAANSANRNPIPKPKVSENTGVIPKSSE